MNIDLFWIICCLSAFIVGLAKSGLISTAGVAGVPLLSLVIAPREAAGILLPLLLVMDGVAIYTYRRDFEARNLAILLPGAAVGIGFGWLISAYISDSAVLLMVGLITIIFISDSVLGWRKSLQGLPPSAPWGVFWGSLSGFTSFVAHAGSPPYQIFVLPQRLAPAVYAGTTAWFFAAMNTTKLVPYFFLGQLSVSHLKIAAIMLLPALAGIAVGIYLVRRISPVLFYRIAYVLIAVLGIKLTYDGFIGTFFAT